MTPAYAGVQAQSKIAALVALLLSHVAAQICLSTAALTNLVDFLLLRSKRELKVLPRAGLASCFQDIEGDHRVIEHENRPRQEQLRTNIDKELDGLDLEAKLDFMTLRAQRLDKLMLEHETKMESYLQADDEMLQLIQINDLEI